MKYIFRPVISIYLWKVVSYTKYKVELIGDVALCGCLWIEDMDLLVPLEVELAGVCRSSFLFALGAHSPKGARAE